METFSNYWRQPRGLKLVDLKEIPMLWSEQREKFYGLDL
ncbi:site-specific recombinase, resolvase family [Wolbachia endosymbiont of Drosophila ananassae]|nr:site-specific recombinase, resolvase family [Wolbachia endosymbiont of Drosophila ananassae]